MRGLYENSFKWSQKAKFAKMSSSRPILIRRINESYFERLGENVKMQRLDQTGADQKTGHVRPAIKRPGTFDRQFERPAQHCTGNTQDRRNVRPAVHNTVRAKNSKLLVDAKKLPLYSLLHI